MSLSRRGRFSSAAIPLIFFAAIILAFVVGTFFGRWHGLRSITPENEGQVLNQGAAPAGWPEDVDFNNFWNVWNFVKDNFYQQPVSDKDLFYGAMKGLLIGLDDPYSVFFDPREAAEFNSDLNGTFEGIGAQIDLDETGQLIIVAPLPDSPAEASGLLSKDKILAIDGLETYGMSVEEAVSKIRGPKGTTVTLTISRDGWEAAEDFILTRETIVIDSVKLEKREDGLAVVSVYLFNEETPARFTSVVNDLLAGGAKGIILDLRSDPGGLLDAAIDIASFWTGQQTVVIQQDAHGSQQEYVGSGRARLVDLPTVVLVNGGSASASEIVAGALQDYSLAKVVGTQTFGKGSVQDYRELEDGSAVKLTTAEWLTPNGRSIDHVGITPDFVVEFTQSEAEAGLDPQMNKAVDLLVASGD
jgi:carboxyl-terminal processing protease